MSASNVGNRLKPGLLSSTIFALLAFAAIVAYTFSEPRGRYPEVLRIAVLPDESFEILRKRYGPLLDYLSAQIGIETRLVIPADYRDAVRLYGENSVDLAYFGGLTYVQAQSMHGAEPLVMRDVDTRFTSWFLVRSEDAHLELADFAGKRLGFGSRLSTSGHLMPRHFLGQRWHIDAESFFSTVVYFGAHDMTALAVRNGEIDIGAVNSTIVRKMLDDSRLDPEELHALLQTPPYPNYVWAVQEDLDEDLKTRLRNAFLRLDAEVPADGRVLAGLNASLFLPANPNDFSVLKDIADKLSLLREQDS